MGGSTSGEVCFSTCWRPRAPHSKYLGWTTVYDGRGMSRDVDPPIASTLEKCPFFFPKTPNMLQLIPDHIGSSRAR